MYDANFQLEVTLSACQDAERQNNTSADTTVENQSDLTSLTELESEDTKAAAESPEESETDSFPNLAEGIPFFGLRPEDGDEELNAYIRNHIGDYMKIYTEAPFSLASGTKLYLSAPYRTVNLDIGVGVPNPAADTCRQYAVFCEGEVIGIFQAEIIPEVGPYYQMMPGGNYTTVFKELCISDNQNGQLAMYIPKNSNDKEAEDMPLPEYKVLPPEEEPLEHDPSDNIFMTYIIP